MPTGTRRCSYFAVTRRNSCSGSMLQPCVSAFIRAADRLVATFEAKRLGAVSLYPGGGDPACPAPTPRDGPTKLPFTKGIVSI